MGNGLEYVSVCCHVADGPLAQPRTTQAKDVTEERAERTPVNGRIHTHTHTIYNTVNKLHKEHRSWTRNMNYFYILLLI